MSNPNKKTNTVPNMIIGYLAIMLLFAALWYTDTQHLKEQDLLITQTETSAKKMHLIAGLIEIVRARTRLSHKMLQAQDVFEKDDLAIELSAMAGDFIEKRAELFNLPLTDEERDIMEAQAEIFPQVISWLERVTQLALEDEETADIRARDIIINQVNPLQGQIIDGYMTFMSKLKNDVQVAASESHKNHVEKTRFRYLLVVFIFIASLFVLVFTTKKILHVERRLHDLSSTDALTGIANRRRFDEKLHEEWARGLRSGKSLSLLLMDIDFFKLYNDHYGHQEGDECLVKVADVIGKVAKRSEDLAARYGGEEFAIILPGAEEAGARGVASILLDRVREKQIPHAKSQVSDYVSLSIGVVSMVPDKENSPERMIKAADMALYSSKENGRNQSLYCEV